MPPDVTMTSSALSITAVEAGRDAVAADFRFHAEIARATQNAHFSGLLDTLGTRIIPRSRLDPALSLLDSEHLNYLRRVNGEHESIVSAIARQDTGVTLGPPN